MYMSDEYITTVPEEETDGGEDEEEDFSAENDLEKVENGEDIFADDDENDEQVETVTRSPTKNASYVEET